MFVISFSCRKGVSKFFYLTLRGDYHTDPFLLPIIVGDEVNDGQRPNQQKNDEEQVAELGLRLDEGDRSF